MSDEMKRLRADLDGVRADLDDLKRVTRRIVAMVTDFRQEVREAFQRVATRDELAGVNGRLDGLAGRIDEMRYDWAKHEARITALEKRRS